MPKIVDHDARRIEILEGCFDLFATEGYAKLSMRQMASSLGVTTGTVYHYFSSKQNIFEELFGMLQDRDIRSVTSQISTDFSFQQRLEILQKFLLVNVDRLSNILKISMEYNRIQRSASSHVLEDFIAAYRKAIMENLHIPESMADIILSMIFGLLVQQIFNSEYKIGTQLEVSMQLIANAYVDRNTLKTFADIRTD
jgi:AcrR family transcriptional regulator